MDDASVDSDAFELRNVAGVADAACAEGALRAALALFLLCQHDEGDARRACDARVSARADAAADCVPAPAFAGLRARPDGPRRRDSERARRRRRDVGG